MRTTNKTFSGSVSDLEKFLTWECKERNKKTKETGYVVIDYFTGKQVTNHIFSSEKEVYEWSKSDLQNKLKNKEIHNNLHIIKRV